MKKSVFFIFITVILVFFVQKNTGRLSQIPERDCVILEEFFSRVLHKERMVYVLCGSKPMGIVNYFSLPIPGGESKQNRVMREGWHTWRRYQHMFRSKKLLLRSIGNEGTDDSITILFLNKQHFKETLEKQSELFEKVLGKKLNAEDILLRFEQDVDPLKSVLKKNHLLMGVLLGYGLYNSQAFQKRLEHSLYREGQIHLFKARSDDRTLIDVFVARKHLLAGQKKISSLSLKVSQRYLMKLCDRIEKSCKGADHSFTGLSSKPKTCILKDRENHPLFGLPIFDADPNAPETHELLEKYSRERRQIAQKYQNRPLLEVFIENL